MDQMSRKASSGGVSAFSHSPAPEELELRKILTLLWDRKWFVVFLTVLLSTLALIRSHMMQPVYQATSQIVIEKKNPEIVSVKEVAPSDFSGSNYYYTQYKLLQSWSLAEKVYEKLEDYIPWDKWSGRSSGGKNQEGIPLSRREKIASLLACVKIEPVSKTELVNILVEDINPELAAKIANVWAQSHIEKGIEEKGEAARFAAGWLTQQLDDVRDSAEGTVREMEAYRKKHNITSDDMFSETLVVDLFGKKAQLEIELSKQRKFFKDKHPVIIGLLSEIASVQAKIKQEEAKALGLTEQAIQYNILKRKQKTNEEIYGVLLRRARETSLIDGLNVSNIRIVDKAKPPRNPVRPRRRRDLLLSIFVGLLVGSTLVFVFEGMSQRIKSLQDLRDLGLENLGAIPFVKIKNKPDSRLIVAQGKNGIDAESFRILRTAITFAPKDVDRKVLLVLSAVPNEGKTTVAANLAATMALAGENTLLIDGDMRHPDIHTIFGIENSRGLSDVVVENVGLGDAIRQTHVDHLSIMPCGTIPPNPAELMGSRAIEHVLACLKDQFDRVIIDAPPGLVVTDSVALASKVDGVVMVVRAESTKKDLFLETLRRLKAVDANILGSVLNMVRKKSRTGYYSYYGYHNQYYQAYAKR